MTRKVILSPRFRREFKRFAKRDRERQHAIEKTIRLMEADPFAPFLETHKLSGTLIGSLACSCGFDCRILFRIERDQDADAELIILTGIGTHEDVY